MSSASISQSNSLEFEMMRFCETDLGMMTVPCHYQLPFTLELYSRICQTVLAAVDYGCMCKRTC